MYRFFSIAVILNWVSVLAVLSIVGLGLENGSGKGPGSMIGALREALSGAAGLQMPAGITNTIVAAVVLSVMTAALWTLLAVAFAAPDGTENSQQDIVVMSGMGICLTMFATMLVLALYTGTTLLGALASVASFATILAGIAHRVFVIEGLARSEAKSLTHGFGFSGAPQPNSKHGSLAMAGVRKNRFVAKRSLQPNH